MGMNHLKIQKATFLTYVQREVQVPICQDNEPDQSFL